ncbi:MAG: hypothetical protein LBR94_09575 [Desulfovibrio sp.]|nr:hypothetical protein [Desulfovibrio sp.]
MKIRPDQLNILPPAQGTTTAAPGGQTKTSNVFGDILAEEQLRANAERGDSAVAPPPPGAGRTDLVRNMLLEGSEEGRPVNPEDAVLNEAFSQVSGTLDALDKYSVSLGSARSLREAHSLLDDIGSRVAGLEKDAGTLRAQYPALDSLLNELKIISVTEKIKFNRGDYLPE